MRRVLWILLLGLTLSCQQKPEDKLAYINGYWEISEVIFKNGNSKSYRYNTTIDYIYIEDFKGFRKKLQPGINNQYQTSDAVESLEVKIENDSLNLYYNTSQANWKETVLEANEDLLKIKNEDEIIYLYKRFETVNLNLEP
jgi:hypothetical protein